MIRPSIVVTLFTLLFICSQSFGNELEESPFKNLPFRFRANLGQWQENVHYGAWSGTANVYFLKNGLSITHWRTTAKTQETLTWNINFLNANSNALPSCEDGRTTNINYTKNNKNIKIDKEYALLKYLNLYDNIDLQYYGYENTLKYDYILRPGAHVESIKMKADGIKRLEIKNGELITHHAWGSVKENKPYSYQIIDGKQVEVAVDFKLYDKTTYGFQIVGTYDKEIPLIIDPIKLIWGTYVGSTNPNSQGYMFDIAIDKDKAVYGTGYYQTSFPTTAGAFQRTFKGGDIDGSNGDAYLFKMSPDGKTLQFSTYIGGIRDEEGKAICVTDGGRVYVAGVTNSTDFPVTSNAYQKTRKGLSDGFIACFDVYQGSLLSCTYLGGTAYDRINDIKVDDLGNVWVGGETRATDFPVKNSPIQGTYQGGVFDGFISKLSANLDALSYSSFIGGAGDDKVFALASFKNTITYTGYSGSSNYITTSGAYQRNSRGGLDVILGRLNTASNALEYSTYIGGTFDDVGNDIDCNASGFAYITGYTTSANYPNTTNTTLKGKSDVFVTSINASGTGIGFSRLVGGSNNDEGTSIIVNALDQVFVAGNSNSVNFPLNQANALDKEQQVFLFSVDYSGSYLNYSMMLGGSKDDYETPRLAFSSKEYLCEVVIGFTTHSVDLPTTKNQTVFQPNKLNGGTANDQPALFKYYFGPALPFCSTPDYYFDYQCLACPSTNTVPPQLICCRQDFCKITEEACAGPITLDIPLKPNDPNYFQPWVYTVDGVKGVQPPFIFNFPGGTRTYSVTYDDGCSKFTKSLVAHEPTKWLSIIPDSIRRCNGTPPTPITANVVGYTQILWSTGETTFTIGATTSGWYKATASGDLCNTTATDSVYVTVIDGPPKDPFTTNNSASYCFPGSYTLSGLHPNDPAPTNIIKYTWSNGAHTPVINITEGGTYCLTKSNECGNVNSCFTVNELKKPIINLGPDIFLCENQSITLSIPDEYKLLPTLWSTGATGNSINVNAAGTYWVEVTNVCGTTRDSIVIGTSPDLPVVNLGPDINKCSPLDFPMLLDAGFANATYLWSTGETSKTITITRGGQYWVKLTNGCGIAADTINILSNPSLQVSLGPDQRFCRPASIALTVPNFGIGTSYVWSTGATGQTITVTQSGTYWVEVQNSCGSAKDTVDIIVDQGVPQPNLGPDFFICPGTSRTLNSNTNGTTYLWNTGATSNTISINTSGIYWVEVQNSCGTKRDSIQVTTQPGLVINLPADTSICNPNILLLSVPVQNTSYLWSTGNTSNSIVVSSSGTYSITLTNACQQISQSINVSFVNSVPSVDLGPDLIRCGIAPINEVLSATTANANKYQWNTGAITSSIVATQKGLYWLKVSNGCGSKTDSIYIIGDPEPTRIANFSLCNANPVELDAKNVGATYLWTPGNLTTQKITVSTTGQYIVEISNACGTLKDTIDVSIETTPPVFDLGPNLRLCSPLTEKIGVSLIGVEYLWSTGSVDSTIIVSTSGTYSLKITNACGTSEDYLVAIVDNSIPIVELGPDKQVCDPVSLVLNAQNTGNIILWNPGNVSTSTYPVFNPGEYTVEVSNSCGIDKDTINIYSYQKPNIDLQDTGTCNTPVLFDVTNDPATYFWAPGGLTSPTYTVTQSGSYTVFLSHPCGIISDAWNVIINTGVPDIDLGNDTLLCTPEGFVLDGGNHEGGKYKWIPNGSTNTTIEIKEAGTYILEVTNYCGLNKDTIEVGANPIQVLALPDTSVCHNTSLNVRTAFVPGYQWEWYSENNPSKILGTTNNINVTPAYPYRNYVVKALQAPCYNLDTVRVNVYLEVNPKIATTDNEGYIPLGLQFIDVNNSGTKYKWNFDDGGKATIPAPYHVFQAERFYTVSVYVENNFGCFGEDTLEILAFDLFIPNLITANNDGKNDKWDLTNLNPYIYVEIFNSWGDRVYTKSGYVDDWDGEGLASGIYYYHVKDVKYNKEFKGWIHLIK